MADIFTPIPFGTTQPQVINLVNRNFAELDKESTTKLYKDANGVPAIIIGILPDGTTGIVIAKEGENVLDAFD